MLQQHPSSDLTGANALVSESSPYLLQHAYNPVRWMPWGREALDLALKEDKPIIVSIGYSACHWCHVMEKESFEDVEVARIMNEYFINIKVDREERPDVDQVYMDALQMMNIRGGWPLNVFLTPDARPFYGGTYYPNAQWKNLLQQIRQAYSENRQELDNSAEEFTRSLNTSDLQRHGLHAINDGFHLEDLQTAYQNLSSKFDTINGGLNKVPKFPMPAVYLFLLRYFHLFKDESVINHIRHTLDNMAMGGLFDQIGGGFARYSTDKEWLVPHFEKMLYDNAQLVSLFSEAFHATQEGLYKEVVYATIKWLEREMVSTEGGFYSAVDADSEGTEGKFYVWSYEELKTLFPEDFVLIREYYDIRQEGNWEHGNNILFRKYSDSSFAEKNHLDLAELKNKIKTWKDILFNFRNNKIYPGIDDKILTSWNALMLKALLDAYKAFKEARFLQLAERNAAFINEKLINSGKLFHTYKNGVAKIEGFLDDYAFVIQSYIHLYQTTFNEQWLLIAEGLTASVIRNFYDPKEKMFYYTSSKSDPLIARKKEIFDNVIPSSNSVMANNLFQLGTLLEDENLTEIALAMLGRMRNLIISDVNFLANWAILLTNVTSPTLEIAIVGKDYISFKEALEKHYLPNVVFCCASMPTQLPLLKNRNVNNYKHDTLIYICSNKTCQAPVSTVKEALDQIKSVLTYL